MALHFLRRWVSGQKARLRDDQLDVELDLAYVTDQVIVMGFPAVGVESIYRNHRADVQRFLAARHGSDFWVFNLCPLRENAYHDDVFQGRVSRYPFPDHHVPPFLYLPLVTREIHSWLSGSDARVAVLHCKAGKGRSGTLACAYLLSLFASPSPLVHDSLQESLSAWSLIGGKEDTSRASPATIDGPSVHSPLFPSGADLSRVPSAPVANALEKVLDLHTSRRMKPSLHKYRPDVPLSKKPKMGISIPSQRRWLSYWSQVLDGKGPISFRQLSTLDRAEILDIPVHKTPRIAKVKLTKLTVRMRELSGIQPHLVQAASMVITSAGKGRAVSQSTSGKLWASLARYSDQLVDQLEQWEKGTRNAHGMVKSSPFKNSLRDKIKMVQSFAQMGMSGIQPSRNCESTESVLTYVLRPLDGTDGGDWVKLYHPAPESNNEGPQQELGSESSCATALPQVEDNREDHSGIILEADRELRIKLLIGEVALGWVWVIPAFHISPDSPTSNLVLSNDDIDFAIGIGKALVDIKISFSCHACT